MSGYLYLSIAIIAEVIATSALKASEELTRIVPTLLAFGGYTIAFYTLTLVFRTIPLGVAYAIWSGVGIALITAAGYVIFKQALDWPAVAGITLIVAGVLTIHLFSGTVENAA